MTTVSSGRATRPYFAFVAGKRRPWGGLPGEIMQKSLGIHIVPEEGGDVT